MMKNLRILTFLIAFFLLFTADQASAATLYSQAANQDVYEGQSFVVDWFLDTEGKSVNSFDLKINFTNDVLEVTEASAGNSVVNLWIKYPSFDNNQGTIVLTGGIPNGANSSQVPIFRTVFRATKTGNANISFDASSKVLLNDGRGTAEILKTKPLVFNVYPASFKPLEISSTTHPDQTIWYSTRDVQIQFNAKPGTDYSFSFSSNIDMIPDDQVDSVAASYNYYSQPDGIYYFKVNSKVGPSNWQEVGVYRVQIDATAPESFIPQIGRDESIFSGNDFLSFSTVDKMSGISHYYIKRGLLGIWEDASSPLKLQRPWVGKHIKIAAFDNAGNKRIAVIEYRGWMPVWLFVVLSALLLVSVIYSIYKKTRNKK